MTTFIPFHRFNRARYRIGQGLGFLFDRSRPAVDRELSALLTSRQWELVAGLPGRDKAHHLAVYQRLLAQGCDDAELLLTALLHDCGKLDERGRAGVSQRTLLVLAGSGNLTVLRRLGSKAGSGWRYGLYLAIEHPNLGASRARAAVCSERVCWLIEHHHDPDGNGDAGLRLLQLADDEV